MTMLRSPYRRIAGLSRGTSRKARRYNSVVAAHAVRCRQRRAFTPLRSKLWATKSYEHTGQGESHETSSSRLR